MEGWEGDEVGFVQRLESIEGMADLFDMDCAGKGCFLGIVALQLEKDHIRRFGSTGRKAYLNAMLIIRDTVSCHWWMMADKVVSDRIRYWCLDTAHLTCSDTNCVVPAASSHFPRWSSPRKGFSGFFSDPSLSLLLL